VCTARRLLYSGAEGAARSPNQFQEIVMSTDVIRIVGYMAGGVAIGAVVLLLDSLLSRLANRFAGRPGQYPNRIGTQFPRLRK
jgi:hypothetical protein